MSRNNIKSVLIVGPNYPRRCGIASHTYQMALTLEKKNIKIKTLAPADCKANFNLNLKGYFNLLKLLKFKDEFDLISLHFVPEEFFFTGFSLKRLFNVLPLISFYILFKNMSNLKLVIHEPPWTKYFFQRSYLSRLVWSKAPLITFFTKTELEKFEKKINFKFKKNQYYIEDVTKDFNVFSNFNQEQSRNNLGIISQNKIFLCIGFINRLKGFDKVLKIFAENNLKNSELYIVGSVRESTDIDSNEYLNSLKSESEKISNAHVLDQYLTYEDFDKWISASNYLIFPYIEISNSGVLGRAKLLNKNVIVSDAGGLKDQINSDDYLFKDDMELLKIIKKLDK